MPQTLEILECPSCGTKNRVSLDLVRAGNAPVCGKCHAPLRLPDAARGAPVKPIEVTDDKFAEQVEQSPIPVLVDLWAPWCGPCRMIAPALEKLAAEWGYRIKVAKVNVDECPATAERLNAGSIPTLVIFKDGREVARQVGALGYQHLKHWVEETAG